MVNNKNTQTPSRDNIVEPSFDFMSLRDEKEIPGYKVDFISDDKKKSTKRPTMYNSSADRALLSSASNMILDSNYDYSIDDVDPRIGYGSNKPSSSLFTQKKDVVESAFKNSYDEMNTGSKRLEILFDFVNEDNREVSSSYIDSIMGTESEDSSDATLSKRDAINRIAIATGDPLVAYNMYLKSNGLMKDSDEDYSSQGLISGFNANDLSSNLYDDSKSAISNSYDELISGKFLSNKLDPEAILKKLEKEAINAENKKKSPHTSSVQDWLKNSPSGRYFNDLDVKRNDNDSKKIDELKSSIKSMRSSYGKSTGEFTGIYNDIKSGTSTIDRLKNSMASGDILNAAEMYIAATEKELNASRPKEGGLLDIASSFGSSFKKDAYDAFGLNTLVSPANENLTKKLLAIDKNDPFALLTYDGVSKHLTKEELVLLKSFTAFEDVTASRYANKSIASDVGSGLYDSARFIAEMWLGGKIADAGIGVVGKTIKAIKGAGKTATAATKGAIAEADITFKGFGKAIANKDKAYISASLKKGTKELVKTAVVGATMPSTYIEPNRDNMVSTDSVYDENGNKLVSSLKYTKNDLSTYVSKASENALSAFVEGGGVLRPALKVFSGILPEVKMLKGVYSGVNEMLEGGISAITKNGIARKMLNSNAYNTVKKLWDNDIAKSMKVGNPLEEMFEEFEEPLLKGEDMRDFFNTRNLMVTAATVGLFSGAFGAMGVKNYYSATKGARNSESELRKTLQDSFGLSDESINNYISLLDNAPAESLGDHVDALVNRVYKSVLDQNEAGSESDKAVRATIGSMVSSSARYAANRARLNSITNSMSSNTEGKDNVAREAISQIEGEAANKAVSSVVNSANGAINTVYVYNLQKKAFLISGGSVDSNGKVVLDEGNESGDLIIAMPNSGKRITVPIEKLHGDGEVRDINEVANEIAEFNTNKYMDEMWSNPEGKIPRSNQSGSFVKMGSYKGKSSVVALSNESNDVLNNEDLKSDQFMPNWKNPVTGLNGTWVRLVKDDEKGTYNMLPVDTKGGSIIRTDKDGNAIKESAAPESNVALDENGSKLIEDNVPSFSSSVFDDEEDADDLSADFNGDIEPVEPELEPAIKTTYVSLADRIANNKQKAESDSKFDGMDKSDVSSNHAEKSAEDFLDTQSGEITDNGSSFTQKFIDDPDYEYDSDPSELSFLMRDAGLTKKSFKIRKLTREKTGRRIDKNGDAFTRTLVFINKKREKSYNSDGTSAEKWVPFANSSILLDGSWYDGAEVSVSTMPLETVENGVKTITRAPIIIVSNKAVSNDELIFTMKSPRLLLAARNSGKITSHQYNRGVTMYNNLVNAVKTGIGSDIVIAIGKPKMSSFRMSADRNADGSKVNHPFRLVTDVNKSDISNIDPAGINFCIRIDGMLFEYAKGSTELEEVPFVNNVGSRSGASMSMVPPVVKNADRDYAPILGPVLNSDAAVNVVSEILKSDMNTRISTIIEAFGAMALSQEDSFLLDTLANSSMYVRDFMKLFIPNHDPAISNGIYMLGGVLYVNGSKIGKLSTLSVEDVSAAIKGNAININLDMFFDDMLTQKSIADVLKIDESIVGNDLHAFLYSIATTSLDSGIYDPPFLFIDEVDLSDESISIIGDTEIVNTLDLPQETLDKINAIYNKRSKFVDENNSDQISHDDFVKMINEANEAIGYKPIDFKVIESPNTGEANAASEMTMLAIKWLAEKAFGSTVVTDKKEIRKVLDEIIATSDNASVKKLAAGKVQGFVYKGVIYIENMAHDVAGHELAHILIKSMKSALTETQYNDMYKNIVAFGNMHKAKIDELGANYGEGGDKYIEFFCDEFGLRFNEHINDKKKPFFLRVATYLFVGTVNSVSKLNGTIGAKFKPMAYNMIVRYAFNSSISDFIFINNVFNSNRELMERVSLISMFSSRNKYEYGAIDKETRLDIIDILFKKKKVKGSFTAPNGNKTNLSNDDWAITQTDEFKSAFAGSKIVDDNDEPLKLYLNENEGLLTSHPVLSTEKVSNQAQSGFLVAKNVFNITDRDDINKLFSDPQTFGPTFFANMLNANGEKYDAVSFKYGDRMIYIPLNIDSFMSSSLSDSRAIRSSYEAQKGYRLFKAMEMRNQGHTEGSIAAATGIYMTKFVNGTTAISDVKFSDEDVYLANVKRAVETGDKFKLKDLYLNSELLALITDPNINVKIMMSEKEEVSSFDMMGDTIIIRVHAGVNKNDYKAIFRDVLFNAITGGSTLNRYKPLHIVAHVENQGSYNLMNYGESNKIIDALNESKHKAISEWSDVIINSADEDFMNRQRLRILNDTGWFVVNSKYMISGATVDAIDMADKVVKLFNGKSFKNSFDARTVLTDFVADLLPSTLVEVKYVKDAKGKHGEYDETSNTITLFIEKDKLSGIKDNSNSKYIGIVVDTIIHEVTHAIQYNISLDSVNGNVTSLYGLSNIDIATAKLIEQRATLKLDDSMSKIDSLSRTSKSKKNISDIKNAAANLVASEVALKIVKGNLSVDEKILTIAIENAVDDYMSLMKEYGIADESNIRPVVEKAVLSILLDTSSSLYVKSSAEASAFAADAVLINTVFRNLEQMVIQSRFNPGLEKIISESNAVTSIVKDDMAKEKDGITVNFKMDTKTDVDASRAYAEITAEIMHELAESIFGGNSINKIGEKVLNGYLAENNITGALDIFSMIKQFLTDLKAATTTTITDYASFVNFMPFEHNGIKSVMDVKKFKDYMLSLTSQMNNIDDFISTINNLSKAGDPFAVSVIRMDKICTSQGMSNYYERLFAYYNQRKMVYVDADGVNRTDIQLAIKTLSSIKRINEIKSTLSNEFIEAMYSDAIAMGELSGNSEAIVLFLEKLGYSVSEWAASEYVKKTIIPTSTMLAEWRKELLTKKDKISSNSSLGIAIRDISIINNTSGTAAVVTNGNSYPAVDRYNAIFKTINDLIDMSPSEILELESKNPYMGGSIVLRAIKSGANLEIVKQVDEFSDLSDSILSDIMIVLNGNITLGKISTDGTRYYISGSSLIPIMFNINSDNDIDDAYKKDGTVLNKVSNVKKMSHKDNFDKKSQSGIRTISWFNGYATAEIRSIIKAYTKFLTGGNNILDGYHVSRRGGPGDGCKFSELMNGVSIPITIGEVESKMDGGLNDILSNVESQITSGNISVQNIKDIVPSRDSYSEGKDGDLKYEKSLSDSSDIDAELDRMIDSGISDNRLLAMYMMLKTFISSDVNLDSLSDHILSDAKLILENAEGLVDKMNETGITLNNNPLDVIATSLLMKRVSIMEASKSIFGSPQEYGSFVKLEKRTQSFNTNGTIPVEYTSLGKRPGGQTVSSEFSDNTFRCEFTEDLSKENPQFYDDVSDTPGTTMISVHMYKEILFRTRGWSKSFEDEFNKVITAYKNGVEYNENKALVKFNPLKLIYVGYRYDSDGQRHRVMIKAQFVPLLSDVMNNFNGMLDKFMDSDESKRIHMSSMRDSVKLGFSNGATTLGFSDLLTISIPRYNKKNEIPIIRKLLLFNDSNFNASIENESSDLLDSVLDEMIGSDGLINLDSIRPNGSSQDDADLNAAIDLIEELRKSDQSINPLDYACMFDPITNAINSKVKDIFEFKMKGMQCSAVTERFYTKQELKFINDDGSMDIMVPMEYFGSVVDGLSYDDAVAKLESLGYINATNSSAIIVRNPAQSNASISPAKIVGVFPRTYGHYISTASEFLNANGGDYDGDKYFLFPVNQKNSPSANKAIFDMLMEDRKTMSGNVDKETSDFENTYASVRDAYGMSVKDESENKDGRFFYDSYVSEISGLGLVGLCTNMISGLLSYVRSDTTYMHGNKVIPRTSAEIAESLSTTSALFSFAVDIATKPLLQNAGITPAKFKLLFAVAAVCDLETTIKFMVSNLIELKADNNSGNYDFGLYTNKNNVLEIVNRSLKLSNLGATETEDERLEREAEEATFINTISRFSSVFSALKHSDDFYDYLRKSSYFDGIVQAEKVTELVNSITGANPNILSFTASGFKSSGIKNARDKVETISDVLTNSSIFYNSDVIKSIYESIVIANRGEQTTMDFDDPFQRYQSNRKDSSIYNDFQEKVIMKKILAYVSYKIGEQFISSNFSKQDIADIKKYMIAHFGISFSFHGGYIHSVTSTPSKLLSISREFGDSGMIKDFFRLYYASASQRDYLRELNKDIKKKKDEAEFDLNPEVTEFKSINEYYKLPGAVLSLYDSVRYGVYVDGANATTSKIDMKNIFSKSKRKSLKDTLSSISNIDSSVIRSIIGSIKTISKNPDGSTTIRINLPATESFSGNTFNSSVEIQLHMKGSFSNEEISLMKDLASSIMLRLPVINTNLSDNAISSVLSSIEEYNQLNKLISLPIHFVDSTGSFARSISTGLTHTYSESMADAKDGSVILTKNIRNLNGYDENGVNINDMLSLSNSILINVRRNVGESSSIISLNSNNIVADTAVGDSLDNIEAIMADMKDMTSVFVGTSPDIAIGTTVSFRNTDNGESRPYAGIVTGVSITDDGYMSYEIISNGRKVVTSEMSYEVKNIDLNTAIKSGFNNLVIFTNDASNIDASRLSGVDRFYVVELKSGAGDYVSNSLTKEDDNNLNCTI